MAQIIAPDGSSFAMVSQPDSHVILAILEGGGGGGGLWRRGSGEGRWMLKGCVVRSHAILHLVTKKQSPKVVRPWSCSG